MFFWYKNWVFFPETNYKFYLKKTTMKHKLIISFGMGLVLATSCSNSNKENTSQNDTDTIVEVVPETKLIVEEVEKNWFCQTWNPRYCY